MTISGNDELLRVEGLTTWYPMSKPSPFAERKYVRAVDGVDFSIRRGLTLGLVGESGSGKTTAGQSILRLIPATAGRVIFDGKDVFTLGDRELRALRKRMQIVFQDPMSSLNPRMSIAGIIAEPLLVHGRLSRADRKHRVAELLQRVGLSPQYMNRYPHEFSGGQRQRIGIARALASEPEFVVCDEPVSSLDVSIQAQILNLLSDLQEQLHLSYLFIAHNLAVVEHFADEVAVMYLGRIVEIARSEALYAKPCHPYTRALLASVPNPDPSARGRAERLPGETPSVVSPPPGCPFHPRCSLTRQVASSMSEGETVLLAGENVRVVKRCASEVPRLRALAEDPGHSHACLLRHEESV